VCRVTLTIYGLVDPRGPELFYVGRTNHLPRRLSVHIGDAQPNNKRFYDSGTGSRIVKDRIRAVIDAGQRLAHVVLELTDDPARELVWMDYLRAQGVALLNKNRPEYRPAMVRYAMKKAAAAAAEDPATLTARMDELQRIGAARRTAREARQSA
jgi:hypothetical protein